MHKKQTHEETQMRRDQFLTMLGLANKSASEKDYEKARYWLQGAGVFLDAMERGE